MTEWICVADALPKETGQYLVFADNKVQVQPYVICDEVGTEWWSHSSVYPPKISHWMPLPSPPVEQQEAVA